MYKYKCHCTTWQSEFGIFFSLLQVPLEQTWVAESYEPLLLRQDKQEMDYVVVNEDLLLTRYPNAKSLRRNLVGTIGLINHRYGLITICQWESTVTNKNIFFCRFLDNCGWINRMAVSPKYSFQKIGEPLVTCLLEFCVNKGIYTVETTSTECQYTKRELLLKMGWVQRGCPHFHRCEESIRLWITISCFFSVDLRWNRFTISK